MRPEQRDLSPAERSYQRTAAASSGTRASSPTTSPAVRGAKRRVPLVLAALLALAACAAPGPEVTRRGGLDLHPGETPQMRVLIRRHAARLGLPEALLHRVIQRESDYRPAARNGPYFGLMQILPQTAATMGHDGPPSDLLDPEVNLLYAGRYLRGAWIIADGDLDEAVGWYARGYYYEARDRCLLVETGLRDSEVSRACR